MPLRHSEPFHHEPFTRDKAPECYDASGDFSKVTIDFVTRDGRVYGFPYSHLIHYAFDANPEIQRDRNAPPERLTLQFSSHDVAVTGWRLLQLRKHFHSAKIASLSAADPRYADVAQFQPFVTEIIVTPIKGFQ